MASLRSTMKCPHCTIRMFNAAIAINPSMAPTKRIAQKKHFSTTTRQLVRSAAAGGAMKTSAGQSIAVAIAKQKEKAMREQEKMGIQDNIGIMPGTFVLPEKDNWSFKLRWLWISTRVQEFLSWAQMRWMFTTKVNWNYRDIHQVAFPMYFRMSKGLSDGDIESIRGILAPGLLQSLQRKVEERKRDEMYQWQTEGDQQTQCVSYKAMRVPVGRDDKTKKLDNGIIQAVVRIQGEQSLQRMKLRRHMDVRKIHAMPEGPKRVKQVTEYIVLNKLIQNGEEVPWKIWGFYQPKTTEKLLADQKETDRKLALMKS